MKRNVLYWLTEDLQSQDLQKARVFAFELVSFTFYFEYLLCLAKAT